jgi:hypothetical protein
MLSPRRDFVFVPYRFFNRGSNKQDAKGMRKSGFSGLPAAR